MAIEFNSVSNSARASKVFIELAGVRRSFASLFIKPHVALVGQYDASKTVTDYAPQVVIDKNDVGSRYGFGSQIHRQALKLPDSVFTSGNGVTAFPIPEALAGVKATNAIVFTGTSASTAGIYYFLFGGVAIQVPVVIGDTPTTIGDKLVTEITASRDIAVTAVNTTGSVAVTCKWKGTTGNQIYIKQSPAGKTQEDKAPAGITVSGVDTFLAGGATDPSVHDVFLDTDEADILGDTWYTVFTAPFSDSTNMGYYKTSGDLRADPAVKRFFGAYPVLVNETRANALLYPASLNSKWIGAAWEARAWAPAFELSAEIAGIIAREQLQAPSRPYKTLNMSGGGDLSVPNSTYLQKDALFRTGIGFMDLDSSGQLKLGDLPLTYRTDSNGGDTEEWFDAVSLHLRQAKVYSIDQLFSSEPYTRGVVVSNNDITINSWAIAPKDVIADLAKLIRDLWEPNGWTKNAGDVIASLTSEIDAIFNGRINASVTDDEAKALRIIAIRYAFLF